MRNFIFLLVYCTYVSLSYGQNVGIGTTTPASGLELKGLGLGSQQRITDPASGNTLVLQSGLDQNLKVTGFNYLTFTAKPLFLSVDGANTIINPNGGVLGIGTASPNNVFRVDISGGVRSFGNSTHFVAETNGGTNSWARYYMRSPSQSWLMGTSQNFNGNQLYIADETFNKTRFSIQPGDGPINMYGNATQDLASNGLPKAMVYLNSNGTIGRCYNGLNGATTGGCGFTSNWISTGNYQVSFPFNINSRFFSVSAEKSCCLPVTISYAVFGTTTINVGVFMKPEYEEFQETDLPLMIIVY